MGDSQDSGGFEPKRMAAQYLNHEDAGVRQLAQFTLFAADIVGVMLAVVERLKQLRDKHGVEYTAPDAPESTESPGR